MQYISDANLEKAKTLFENIEKDNFYTVSGDIWMIEDADLHMDVNVKLDDNQVELIEKLLEESEYCSLSDLAEEIPFYDKFAPELYQGSFIPRTIDTDHSIHYYPFTCMIVDREKETAEPQKVKIIIKDDDYVNLLAWRLDNPDESFNTLVMYDSDLYARISKQLSLELGDPEYGYYVRLPFVVFPDCLDEHIKAERTSELSRYY